MRFKPPTAAAVLALLLAGALLGPPLARTQPPPPPPPSPEGAGEQAPFFRGRSGFRPGPGMGVEMLRRVHRLRMEVFRLNHAGAVLEGLEERLDKGDFSEESHRRLKRMLELRRELLDLEKQEIVHRVRDLTSQMLEQMEDRAALAGGDGPLQELREDMMARLRMVHEAATDFESLSAVVLTMGPDQPQDPAHAQPRLERLRQEYDALRQRGDRLRQEMEFLGAPPPPGSPPPHREWEDEQGFLFGDDWLPAEQRALMPGAEGDSWMRGPQDQRRPAIRFRNGQERHEGFPPQQPEQRPQR